jgi:hypothetical protein
MKLNVHVVRTHTGIVGCFTRTDQEYSLYKDIGKDERVKGTHTFHVARWDVLASH